MHTVGILDPILDNYTLFTTQAFTVKLPGAMKANINNNSRTLRRAR